MKLVIINGPNLNMLGIREPDHCENRGVEADFFQSNHEGALVDRIQQAYFDGADGIVINPGAYTHTSVALLDAVKSVMLPTVEVHISDVSKREDFRQVSFIRAACIKTVAGHGFQGYLEAVDALIDHIGEKA